LKISGCSEKAVIDPTIGVPEEQGTQGGAKVEEEVDAREVLGGGEDMAKKGDMVREEEGSRDTFKALLPGNLSSFEECFLECGKGIVGTPRSGVILPKIFEGGGEFRRGS
jgi:hypothetical protein